MNRLQGETYKNCSKWSLTKKSLENFTSYSVTSTNNPFAFFKEPHLAKYAFN